MAKEIEVKFLNIEPREIEVKLKKIGAKKIFSRLYRRRVFDFPDLRLNKAGAYLRLRDEGDKIVLAFKRRLGMKSHEGKANDRGMEEIQVEVHDFEKTAELLLKLGLIEKFYEENKRIRYQLGDLEFDNDFWPKLLPYLEIEASSWKELNRAMALLGLNPKEKKIFSTQQVYKLSGVNEDDYKEITFKRLVKKKKHWPNNIRREGPVPEQSSVRD